MSSSSDSFSEKYSDRYSDEACQQIKLDGEPCRAAALRGKKFCYYHLHCGPPPKDVSNPLVIPQVQFHLPLLDDATSIQATITLVCEHLLHRRRNSANLLQASPSDPASSDTPPTGQDDSAATPSDDPDRLPPGTIQACQQRRRSAV
jgi:hypothetical protein